MLQVIFLIQDLKDYFRSAGEITYANAHSPRTGDGIVEFATRKGMDYALDHKDELELDGKKLKITVRSKIKQRTSDITLQGPFANLESTLYIKILTLHNTFSKYFRVGS